MTRFLGIFAARYNFTVHSYSVMPDHFHALAVGLDTSSDLLVFVKARKQKTNREFQRRFHRLLWRKKFYDHILRDGDGVASVAAYIWLNPVRKGLCVEPHEYPYSGSFTIDWKKHFGRVQAWVPPWKEKAPAFPARDAGTRRAGKAAATKPG